MEGAAVENLSAPVAPLAAVEEASVAVDTDRPVEDGVPKEANHGDTQQIVDVSLDEMRSIIEVIADTGKFWHDWSFLKGLLSLQLKQVLAEYPEAQTVSREAGSQQSSLSGETYSELVNRLDDALLRFEEGPPFTLQRLCEILLDPKGTYTKLSKLALALEKNLLVTSTMTKCTDPYPAAQGPRLEGNEITGNTDDVDVEPERLFEHPAPVPNGTEHGGGDCDEEMADAEAEESGSRDIEMQEDKPDQIPNVNSEVDSTSAVTTEAVNLSEHTSEPHS